MASTDKGKRTPLWWNDGPEIKQPLGTRQAVQRGSGFRTDGLGEGPRHRSVQTHPRDRPAGWAEPEPGARSRGAGMVAAAVRAPVVSAGGLEQEARAGVAERPEAGGAVGVAKGG